MNRGADIGGKSLSVCLSLFSTHAVSPSALQSWTLCTSVVL